MISKDYFMLVFFIFLINFFFAQEKKIEEIYQECAYNSLKDKGELIRKHTVGFENYLVEAKILKDCSGKSYYCLLKSISEGKKHTTNFNYSFIDSININRKERQKIFPINIKCIRDLSIHKNYKKFKQRFSLIIQKEVDVNKSLKKYLEILYPSDFELEYYKQRVMILLYLFN